MLTNDLGTTARLDQQAVRASLDALATWRPDVHDPATPCAAWRLSDLVAHMTIQQHGFARALAGERTALDDWTPVRHDDPLGAYREACERVIAVCAGLSAAAAPVLLPEVSGEALPAATVLGFHLVDNVVHAWDAARSLGVQPELADDALAAACAIARQVPDGDARDRPGASFAHRLPAAGDASVLAELLSLLGRDPGWTPQR